MSDHTSFCDAAGRLVFFRPEDVEQVWRNPLFPDHSALYLLRGGAWIRFRRNFLDGLTERWEVLTDDDAVEWFLPDVREAPGRLKPLIDRRNLGHPHHVAAGVEVAPALELVPGGFVFHDRLHDLCGNPWQILQLLLDSRWHRVTAADLKSKVWSETSAGKVDQAIKDAVCDLRKVLQRALREVELAEPKDPLPCVDSGRNLAWKLAEPLLQKRSKRDPGAARGAILPCYDGVYDEKAEAPDHSTRRRRRSA